MVSGPITSWQIDGNSGRFYFLGLQKSLWMVTAAAAKSLQSCLTNSVRPHRWQPTRLPIPGILQARTLEWVAISFSNAWKWSRSVVLNSLRPHGLQPTRLLHPWDFPGKSTRVGCHCLLWDSDCNCKIKMLAPFKRSYDQPRQCIIKKQKHHFAIKSPSSQSYGFSSSHVWIWELDHKEGWALKNWCFQTVVLEKTLENPLDSKEIKPVSSKGNWPWIFTGRTDAEAEAPILWPPDAKSWLIGKDPEAGKDWRREEKGMTENEMVGWHPQLNGANLLKFEQTLKTVRDRDAWCAAVHGVAKSRTSLCDWTTTIISVTFSNLPEFSS